MVTVSKGLSSSNALLTRRKNGSHLVQLRRVPTIFYEREYVNHLTVGKGLDLIERVPPHPGREVFFTVWNRIQDYVGRRRWRALRDRER
jgi:hypothetical protein